MAIIKMPPEEILRVAELICIELTSSREFYRSITPSIATFGTLKAYSEREYKDVRRIVFNYSREIYEREHSPDFCDESRQCVTAMATYNVMAYYYGDTHEDTNKFIVNRTPMWVHTNVNDAGISWNSEQRPFVHMSNEAVTPKSKSKSVLSTVTTTTTTKEYQMKIENNVTLIDNRNAAEMSDDQIFALIRSAEANIETMKTLKTESKKMKAKISEAEGQIAQLVAIVDSRP